MRNQWSFEEIVQFIGLLRVNLEELYVYYELGNEDEAKLKAAYLLSKYQLKIRLILDPVNGDTISPEGLAEMILIEEYMKKNKPEVTSDYMFH